LPLGDPFWVLSLELESFFFVPFVPFWWVLCLMVFNQGFIISFGFLVIFLKFHETLGVILSRVLNFFFQLGYLLTFVKIFVHE